MTHFTVLYLSIATAKRKVSHPLWEVNKIQGTMVFHLRPRVYRFQEIQKCKTKNIHLKLFSSRQAKKVIAFTTEKICCLISDLVFILLVHLQLCVSKHMPPCVTEFIHINKTTLCDS